MEPQDYGYGILTALSEGKQHVSDKNSGLNKPVRLGQKSQPLNCFWIVEQDAVVEWALLRCFHQLLQSYSTVRRWDDEIEF